MSEVFALKLLAIGVPASILFAGALILFVRHRTIHSCLQLIGAGFLMVVVLTHLAEALCVFPFMKWGLPDSAGHYLDLFSAVLALTLFPTGYLLGTLGARRL